MISIIFPLLGLFINNGDSYSGVFGNFKNYWFYILAIINGIVICLPNFNNKLYRLILFSGRGLTFSYTLYFFLVFLPFLPFSALAIIIIGSGFLMLTPLLLFVIHITTLSEDFKYLKTSYSLKQIISIGILSFLTIPVFITISYIEDKRVLNQALTYLYCPDYSKKYEIDKISLQKTLNIVKHHKNRNRDFLGNQTPYLSSFFNWLVLDNLTLSDTKINHIENVFWGLPTPIEVGEEDIRRDSIQITHVSNNSVYDKSQNIWKTWINLELTNYNKDRGMGEYTTTFNLPEGSWISDYYLYIGDRKEFGILAEKKSAMWVFSNIRNTNRDPGILYYLTGNKVAFRVFPFLKEEIRKTGFEILHKEPIKLTIDNKTLELGRETETIYEKIETPNIIYIPSKEKQTLKQVNRKPYFHFLIDASKDKNRDTTHFAQRIETFLDKNKTFAENAKISFVNTYVNTFPLDNNWRQYWQSQVFEGGFYLERAINNTLFNAYKNGSYPIIVVVTDNIEKAILNKDFSDFKFAFPESNLFFNLNENALLKPHSLIGNPIKPISDSTHYSFNHTVLEYKLPNNTTAFLPKDSEPSIILKNNVFETNEADIKEKIWQSALIMQANWRSQILHPEISNRKWSDLVKYSFISKIMTPVTSFLSVENESQKAILKEKQTQVLSGSKFLDLDENSQDMSMSEPNLAVFIILLSFILWYRQRVKV